MFLYSIKQIVAAEYNKFIIRLVQKVPVLVLELVDGLYACKCLFSRRYQLPCQDIFHIHHGYPPDHGLDVTEPPFCNMIWNRYLQRFAIVRMEMYEAGVSDLTENIGGDLELYPE